MEKKRKLLEADAVDSENTKVKKNKKDHKQNENDNTNDKDTGNFIDEKNSKFLEADLQESDKSITKKKKDHNKKTKSELTNDEISTTTSVVDKTDISKSHNDKDSKSSLKNTLSQEKTSKKEKKKKEISAVENGHTSEDNETETTHSEIKNNENTSESIDPSEVDCDGINTPTTKKPPRKSGETKKQYKRRMKALREAGLLIDPPVVEGVKKDKRNRKTRKEKRMAKQTKTDELDKFRLIVQINYLKMWKTEPSKWKFNKNVQGKIIKHMFDTSRVSKNK